MTCGKKAEYKKDKRKFCKEHAILLDKEYQSGIKNINDESNLEKIIGNT